MTTPFRCLRFGVYWMCFFSLLWTTSIILFVKAQKDAPEKHPDYRPITFINESGGPIQVYWINHYENRRLMPDSEEPIAFGATSFTFSYVSHEFEIHQVPTHDDDTHSCLGGGCRKAHFKVNDARDQVIRILQDFTLQHEDSKTRARDQAKTLLNDCTQDLQQANQDVFLDCVQQTFSTELNQLHLERTYLAQLRNSIGDQLGNYACHDQQHFPQAESILRAGEGIWVYQDRDGFDHRHERQVLFRPTQTTLQGQIQIIPDFFPHTSYCPSLERHASSNAIPWSVMTKDSRIINLVDKIYTLLRETLHEQQFTLRKQQRKNPKLFSMHTITAENSPQDCSLDEETCRNVDSLLVEVDSRQMAASVILICQAPEQGGAIHFPHLGVHISTQDRQGSLLLITYDANDSYTNTRRDCPVLAGQQTTFQHDVYRET